MRSSWWSVPTRIVWPDLGWLRLTVLWVRADLRGCGVGSRLLAAAEDEACRRGWGQMALSTHTFQARDFYAHRGYVDCGLTPDYPRGHAEVHFVKRLSAAHWAQG